MQENRITITEQSVTKHVELITKKGFEYATAILSLVPELKQMIGRFVLMLAVVLI